MNTGWMFSKEEDALLEEAISAWGQDAQWGMAQEECAELIAAINKKHRGLWDGSGVDSEIADVLIMMRQLILMCNEECIYAQIRHKLRRLKERIQLGKAEGEANDT